MAVRGLELNPQEILFIGDCPTDIKAGKRAGAFTGAAMWGANREERARILDECARVLKENGARKVYVLAISRAYINTVQR